MEGIQLHRTAMSPKRVVLFDRDQTILLVMKHLLDKLGFSVSMANSTDQGLELIQATDPQLIVWELGKQPDIDFHMLQEIHRQSHRPHVILLSTPETLHDDAPIEYLGTGDVFIKPFEPTYLIRRIKWLVKQERI